MDYKLQICSFEPDCFLFDLSYVIVFVNLNHKYVYFTIESRHEADMRAAAVGGRLVPDLPRRLHDAGAAGLQPHLLRAVHLRVAGPRTHVPALPRQGGRRTHLARRIYNLRFPAILKLKGMYPKMIIAFTSRIFGSTH